MNLKKNKKLKRKYDGFQAAYNTFAGIHLYRSEKKDAPFSEWQRLTDRPTMNLNFTDRYEGEDKKKIFYYKVVEVDVFGNQSEPRDVEDDLMIIDDQGGRRKRDLKTTIFGINIYWSLDPNLPLDQWTKQNDQPIEDEHSVHPCPVREPYYMYSKYVNPFGEEFGKPSDIQKIIPRP